MRLQDRLLVEWVAQAKKGDQFPPPWCNASKPLESVMRTLIELGVIKPVPGADWAAMAPDATVAARAWLDEHPPAGGA